MRLTRAMSGGRVRVAALDSSERQDGSIGGIGQRDSENARAASQRGWMSAAD